MFDLAHLGLFNAAIAGFFAIMNPIANTPIFLGLTDGVDASTRRKVALQSTLVAFGVVVAFAALGDLILSTFGITIGAFRIAGGVLIFSIGYKMLQGEHSSVQHTERSRQIDRESRLPPDPDAFSDSPPASRAAGPGVLSIAVSPLGVPLLAGPGTIATAIGFAAGGPERIAITVAAFATLCVGTYVCFAMGERLVRVVGTAFMTVITRLMGLILAVVGTQMFLHGLKQVEL